MAQQFSPALAKWQSQGRYVDVYGHQVFVVTAGQQEAPALCILHGFPSFSYDYCHVLQRLAERYFVVVHDHLGFGLSAKPVNYSYSLVEQAEVALQLWHQLGIRQAHVLGHDYGTSVSTEVLAKTLRTQTPVSLQSLTLCNGSVHIELAQLTLSQKLMRSRSLGKYFVKTISQGFFKKRFRNLFADPTKISEEELDVLWEGITANDGRYRLPQISQYLYERVSFWHRWIGALKHCNVPAHVFWGTEDPIAVSAIARKLHEEIPQSQLTWLEGIGHYPMIENPERWAAGVLGFLDKLPQS